jgi:hypothetical protein
MVLSWWKVMTWSPTLATTSLAGPGCGASALATAGETPPRARDSVASPPQKNLITLWFLSFREISSLSPFVMQGAQGRDPLVMCKSR